MVKPPNDREHKGIDLEQVTRTLEHALMILLFILAIAIVAGAILIILTMDSSSRSQGGRFYVAIIALVLLGVVDSQITRLVKQRAPFSLVSTPVERRYSLVSLLLFLVAAAVLIGLAWLAP